LIRAIRSASESGSLGEEQFQFFTNERRGYHCVDARRERISKVFVQKKNGQQRIDAFEGLGHGPALPRVKLRIQYYGSHRVAYAEGNGLFRR